MHELIEEVLVDPLVRGALRAPELADRWAADRQLLLRRADVLRDRAGGDRRACSELLERFTEHSDRQEIELIPRCATSCRRPPIAREVARTLHRRATPEVGVTAATA